MTGSQVSAKLCMVDAEARQELHGCRHRQRGGLR